jgi:type I site-specific restriction endonuclease
MRRTGRRPDAGGLPAASRARLLVTIAMAYEYLDVPEVAVVATLTEIQSRPWLEQIIARATRIDPHAGHTWRSAP